MATEFKIGDHVVVPYGATGRIIDFGPPSEDPGNQVVYILRDKPRTPGVGRTKIWAFVKSLTLVEE